MHGSFSAYWLTLALANVVTMKISWDAAFPFGILLGFVCGGAAAYAAKWHFDRIA